MQAGSHRCARRRAARRPCGGRTRCCGPAAAARAPRRRASPRRANVRAPATAGVPTARPCRSCARWRSAPDPAAPRLGSCSALKTPRRSARATPRGWRCVAHWHGSARRLPAPRLAVPRRKTPSTRARSAGPASRCRHRPRGTAHRGRCWRAMRRCAAAARHRRRRSTSGSPSTRPALRASTRRCGCPRPSSRAAAAPTGCW